MILILFTTSYPYITGGEQNFIEMEAAYLLDSFERVIIVPEKRAGAREDFPPRLELVDSYAGFLQSHGRFSRFFSGLFSGLVYREIIRRPEVLIKPPFLKRLIFAAGHAELTNRWLVRWMREQGIRAGDCLFYTYWFNEVPLGLGLARRIWPELRLVSRAHGYDLYEEVNRPPYWPCRESALNSVDAVFSVSLKGAEYLRQKYPGYESKIRTARLGLSSPRILAQSSSDHIYRIVSCSKLVPVKRVQLIMQGITAAAARRPSQEFEWCHLGVGPLRQELEAALSLMPVNVTACFAGYSGQADVFRYYRDHPVDVFINTSASEGTPVAIMEAISCGIPVIATAVGGNAEIVSEKNGHLLPASPTPEQVADALLSHWDEPAQRRAGSLEVWAQNYDATLNYSDFVKRLVEIRA